MKFLINICAHDGIISHYNGVGTMVKRYILVFMKLMRQLGISYKINLFTPEYNESSFGFSLETKIRHCNLADINIIPVSNGSGAMTGYGTPENWKKLSLNTAAEINSFDMKDYDLTITLANDTPFAGLLKMLFNDKKHKKVWIPHSTGRIHLGTSDTKNSYSILDERLIWEEDAVNYINSNLNSFLGSIGKFISAHLVENYNLNSKKIINIYNGEILSERSNTRFTDTPENKELYNKIKNFDRIIFSFGRAEEYKNLESTMHIGHKIGIQPVVIAQSYYKEQHILQKYRNIAKETASILYIDPPFDFAHYLLNNFINPIIVLIPSLREPVGIIINEVRSLNRNNILITANNIDGISEQIDDEQNGVLIDINNFEMSEQKIKNNFNSNSMKSMNNNSQIKLKQQYDLEKNCLAFLSAIMNTV
jgi:glycosyltransferase involved in cell wall biosynthesis